MAASDVMRNTKQVEKERTQRVREKMRIEEAMMKELTQHGAETF
jgi:hypothetical protein